MEKKNSCFSLKIWAFRLEWQALSNLTQRNVFFQSMASCTCSMKSDGFFFFYYQRNDSSWLLLRHHVLFQQQRQLITPGYAGFWRMSVHMSWERHLRRSVQREVWTRYYQVTLFMPYYNYSEKKNCLIHHNGENYTLPSNLQFHLSISTLPYWWFYWGTFVVLFLQLPAGMHFLLQ